MSAVFLFSSPELSVLCIKTFYPFPSNIICFVKREKPGRASVQGKCSALAWRFFAPPWFPFTKASHSPAQTRTHTEWSAAALQSAAGP